MKTIIVLRHATAHSTDKNKDDFARRLTKIGRTEAAAVSKMLAQRKLSPDLVLASAAARTLETAQLVAAKAPVKKFKSLYCATAEQWLERIRKLTEKTQTVLLVGHNPECEDLVLALTNQRVKMKKSSFALIQFDDLWEQLAPASARYSCLLSPAQLDKPTAPAAKKAYTRWTDQEAEDAPAPQNRELSWLSFNARVLQEADDPEVPLLNQLQFISIVSANLDEFIRVRVGAIGKELRDKKSKKNAVKAREIFTAIDQQAAKLQRQLEQCVYTVRTNLGKKGVNLISEQDFSAQERRFCRAFCDEHIRPSMTVLTNLNPDTLKNAIITDNAYLMVTMTSEKGETEYALIRIPTDQMDRFVTMPPAPRRRGVRIAWLDDVIRAALVDIFGHFGFTNFSAHTVKLTRSAQITTDDKFTKHFASAIKEREKGTFVNLTYARDIPNPTLNQLIKFLKLDENCLLTPGGRYNNIRDFDHFPRLKEYPQLFKQAPAPSPHPVLSRTSSLLDSCVASDHLLHTPYHDFSLVPKLLREASVDPAVSSIYITIYRLAPKSQIAGALINALENGKQVCCMVEPRARFDEAANLHWIKTLKEAGADVIDVATYKTHAKVILINRAPKHGRTARNVAVIGTGNFNEKSARMYTDFALITANADITKDALTFFNLLRDPDRQYKFKKLLVAPKNMQESLIQLIRNEIKNAAAKKPCGMQLKLNNLSEAKLINALEEAAAAGVPISMVIRGVCGLDPEKPQLKGNIRIISIIDSLLEHARIMIFNNNNQPKIFIGSADWMPRNIRRRQEVYTPILDSQLIAELQTIMQIQEADNTKARILNSAQDNTYVSRGKNPPRNAQRETRRLYRDLWKKSLATQSS